ncbi:MAG: hypothetical protein EXS36_04205 [Pedosphaera sp.]|nr:hypothetical protein [Pedosphaera sp.]
MALLFLPVIPGAHWKPSETSDPTWRLFALLTGTIGLPYGVLAATSPLLQKWFSLIHPASPRPYRLYVLSNMGSLLALVTYPFLFEALLTRKTEAGLWAVGFGAYAVLAVVCGMQLWRSEIREGDASPDLGSHSTDPPPSLSLIPNRTTFEDTTTPAIEFTPSDTETPAAILEVSAVSTNPVLLPPIGIALGGSGANRTLTLTPAKDESGVATVSVVVKDGGSLMAANRFELTVIPVNDPPTLASIADTAVNENAPLKSVNFSGITTGAANEFQTLLVTATSSNPALIPTPTVDYTSPQATGALSFQPLPNTNGTATITVTVKDSGGTANGGQDTFSRQFTVTVNPVNAPPTVRLTAPNEGESFGFGTSIPLTAIANDIDSPVSKVEFFDGTTKLGEDLTAPYALRWSGVPIGEHTLTAKAPTAKVRPQFQRRCTSSLCRSIRCRSETS